MGAASVVAGDQGKISGVGSGDRYLAEVQGKSCGVICQGHRLRRASCTDDLAGKGDRRSTPRDHRPVAAERNAQRTVGAGVSEG